VSAFKPKQVLAQAKEAEKSGDLKLAAMQYLALSVYLRKKKRLDEALLLAQKASKLRPDSIRLLLQIAVCQELLGNQELAKKTLRAFVRSAMERKRIQAYRPYVDAVLKDSLELQKVYLELVLELDRTRPQPFLEQARSFLRANAFEDARKALYAAIKTRGADAEASALLRECFRDSPKAKDAGRILDKFLNASLPRDELAPLLEKLCEPEGSSGSEDPEFRTQENDLQKLIQNLEKELGIDLEEGHDKVEPLVQEFRRRSDPILGADPKARLDMALAFYEMGLFAHARAELQGIAETSPLYGQVQVLLGEIHFAEGSDLAALECFQRALRYAKAEDKDLLKEAQYRLIQLYHRLGDLTQALRLAEHLETQDAHYRDLRHWKMQILEALSENQ
jgi:tetratricopeptide (TPR) repeat protein